MAKKNLKDDLEIVASGTEISDGEKINPSKKKQSLPAKEGTVIERRAQRQAEKLKLSKGESK